ncbi:RNA pyrophosphohydrolase [Candidatus Hepatincolaceae symbiont of Richtersius coronifer]
MEIIYRQGVGAVVINKDNKVLMAQRLDNSSAWQMPQGGIEPNETLEEALLRELKEEIGTNNIKILAKTNLLRYKIELPNNSINKDFNFNGQEQVWFFVKFLGKDSDINVNTPKPEFSQWKWMPHEEIPNKIVSFKKQLYQDIIKQGLIYNIWP